MRVVIPVIILIVLELLVFKGAWMLTRNWSRPHRLLIALIFWSVTITILAGFINMGVRGESYWRKNPQMAQFWLAATFTWVIPQVVFVGFHLLDDIVHVFRWLFAKLTSSGASDAAEAVDSGKISRADFLTRAGLITGGITFGGFLHGVTLGKYKFTVRRETIQSDNIGPGLDGVTFVQISDLHLGSFGTNAEPIRKAVDLINDLKADYILFTGDMVNDRLEELYPFMDEMKRLKANHGMFGVFGNHDQDAWEDEKGERRHKIIPGLQDKVEEMGFTMLRNAHVVLDHAGSDMELIGVDNWGRSPHWFGRNGDLSKALEGTDSKRFQMLMSHDPAHYEDVVTQESDIDLTLSGHTHGLQMGLEIPSIGVKLSPAGFVYKHWAGRYTEGKQEIYVNRGLGFLAFPGRVGIFPEITLFTLKSGKA